MALSSSFAMVGLLTRQRFVVTVHSALREAGHYAGHSFRIGTATTAAARGLEDSTV